MGCYVDVLGYDIYNCIDYCLLVLLNGEWNGFICVCEIWWFVKCDKILDISNVEFCVECCEYVFDCVGVVILIIFNCIDDSFRYVDVVVCVVFFFIELCICNFFVDVFGDIVC